VVALAEHPEAGFAYAAMAVRGGATIFADPPMYGNIGTPMLMHTRATLREGTWGTDSAQEDWNLVERWLNAGVRYVAVHDAVTVDVWPSGQRRGG
jgi:hypothetical protein